MVGNRHLPLLNSLPIEAKCLSHHGLAHWLRVAELGTQIGQALAFSSAEMEILVLFGLLHDAGRIDDRLGMGHGMEAVEIIQDRRELLELGPCDLRRLSTACLYHECGMMSKDPVIGACWDADRLELWRLRIPICKDMLHSEAASRLVGAHASDV